MILYDVFDAFEFDRTELEKYRDIEKIRFGSIELIRFNSIRFDSVRFGSVQFDIPGKF